MGSYFPTVGAKDNQNNREIMLSTTRELRTSHIFRLCGRGFEGTVIDSNYWASTVVTGGTAVQANGIVSLKTTTASGSSSKIVSSDIARYVSSASNIFRWTGRFTTAGVANNTRRLGAYDSNNGFFVQLNGTTFSIVSRKATVDTSITVFNGNLGTSYTMDTNTHAFEIVYGVGTIEWYIDGTLLHKLFSATDPLTAMYSFPCTFENINTGVVTGSPQLDCRGASISRLGEFDTAPASAIINTATTTVLKLTSGVLKRILYTAPVNSSTITIYDNTAGTGTRISYVAPPNGIAPFELNFDLPFNVGLAIVSIGTGTWTIIYE
jgi:hypothetical protein